MEGRGVSQVTREGKEEKSSSPVLLLLFLGQEIKDQAKPLLSSDKSSSNFRRTRGRAFPEGSQHPRWTGRGPLTAPRQQPESLMHTSPSPKHPDLYSDL